MKKKKLAIFDMDGTLFDTTDINYYAYYEAAKEFGYEIQHKVFIDVFTGKNYKEFLPVFGIKETAVQEKIHEIKKEQYSRFFKYAKKNEYLFYLIQCIKQNFMIGLATTASRRNTYDILAYFDAEKEFDIIVSQEDVKRLKPAPDCYLEVMARAGILPKDTIVFEDSDVGVEAARAGGAYVVRVDKF